METTIQPQVLYCMSIDPVTGNQQLVPFIPPSTPQSGHLQAEKPKKKKKQGDVPEGNKTSSNGYRKWKMEEEEGIMDHMGGTIRDNKKIEIILKKCPYFIQLDDIYGTTVSVNPYYVHESSKKVIKMTKNSVPKDGEDPTPSSSSAKQQEDGEDSGETSGQKTETSTAGEGGETPKVKKQQSPTVDKLKDKLMSTPKGSKSEQQKNGIAALSEEAKINLEKEKFQFEKQKHEDSQTLKEKEIESKERIERYRIELEMKYKYAKQNE